MLFLIFLWATWFLCNILKKCNAQLTESISGTP